MILFEGMVIAFRVFTLVLVGLLALGLAIGFEGDEGLDEEYASGQIIVRTVDGVFDLGEEEELVFEEAYIGPLDLKEEFESVGADEVKGLLMRAEGYENVYLIEIDADADVKELAKELERYGGVVYAEPNYFFEFFVMPQDPDIDLQWGLHNIGQNGGTIDSDIDGPEAWNIEYGESGVVIAVIDSGILWTHSDLEGNIWVNEDEIEENGFDDDGNGYVDDVVGWDFVGLEGTQYLDDCNQAEDCSNEDWDPTDVRGHGTHVAGIVGAVSDNIIERPLDLTGDIVWDYGERLGMFLGVAVDNDVWIKPRVVFTSEDDNGIYFRNRDLDDISEMDYSYGHLFDAPSPEPRGITVVDGKYWISDPELDLIYGVGIETSPISVMKVRLIVTDSNGFESSEILEIAEIEFYNTGVDLMNLALGSIVSASGGSNPGNVIDGNEGSLWIVQNGDPSWIEIDLGQMTDIDKIVINSLSGGVPVDYSIEIFDGFGWSELFNVVDNKDIYLIHNLNEEVNILESFSSPGPEPRGLDWDGVHFWNVDAENNEIYRMTESGFIVDHFNAPDLDSWGITSNGNYVFVSGDESDKTFKMTELGQVSEEFDTATKKLWGPLAVSKPRGLAWDYTSGYLFTEDIGSWVQLLVPFYSSLLLVHSESSSEMIEVGVSGVCWECEVMNLKAGWANIGNGGTLLGNDIVDAVEYSVNNGADIISMSFGSPNPFETLELALEFAHESGLVLVGAAGNYNGNVEFYPAAYEEVMAVAATDKDDKRAGFSAYGEWVDISAPGENILSTYVNDLYIYASGTSMATPYVAGVAGLLLSEDSGMTSFEVRQAIEGSADDIDWLNPGFEGMLGSGRVNAYNALNFCLGDVNGDGEVGVQDISAIVLAWGGSGEEDLNGDGIVDTADIVVVVMNWGLCGYSGGFDGKVPLEAGRFIEKELGEGVYLEVVQGLEL
jgi:subtilisin family serine protease